MVDDSSRKDVSPHRGTWSLTAQLAFISGILVVSVGLGLIWDFRVTGLVLAVVLVGLAGLRGAGRAKVFAARSRRFDVFVLTATAISLVVFSWLAPG